MALREAGRPGKYPAGGRMQENKPQAVSAELSEDRKSLNLEPAREDIQGTHMATDQGVRIPNTDDSLKAGPRGPTLIEDFHFREKITHFDHERIPERAVHARGS